MKLEDAVEEIISQLPNCSISQIKYAWKILYEDWEDFPDNRQDAIELMEEEISCDIESIKIKKIHKKFFGDDAGE